MVGVFVVPGMGVGVGVVEGLGLGVPPRVAKYAPTPMTMTAITIMATTASVLRLFLGGGGGGGVEELSNAYVLFLPEKLL